MEAISFVVPAWMNWLSLPVLAMALLFLDYCAAVWLQPSHIPSSRAGGNATTRDIFVLLAIFSLIGSFWGAIASLTGVSLGRAVFVELVMLAFFAWALLPKKLWLVAAICYEAAFLASEVIISYNATVAGMLMIGIIITIFILAITIGPISLMKTK